MDEDLRVCSRDSCRPKNIVPTSTVKCFKCEGFFHLLCYEIQKSSAEIFLKPNIVFLCDKCLSSGVNTPSPKRKLKRSGVEQADQFDSTSATASYVDVNVAPITNTASSSDKNVDAVLSPLRQLQTSVKSILSKIDTNTMTLKMIDSKLTANNAQPSVAGKPSRPVPSFASVFHENASSSNTFETHFPKFNDNRHTSKPKKSVSTPQKPSIFGTSTATIGRPLSPRAPPKKSIWISRLHRDTTEDDIEQYIKTAITSSCDVAVRKLVKKDRDLTSYSFVSFRVTCTADFFDALMDPKIWPSTVTVREFEAIPNQNTTNFGSFFKPISELRPTNNTPSIPSKNLLTKPPGSIDSVSQI